jgi:acyl-CoA thioester hydrolase
MDADSKRPLEIELPFHAKTYDIDFGGVVSNIVYVRWLEDLRFRIMEVYCPLEHQLSIGVGPVLLNTQIEYRKSLKLGERPIGKMWVDNMTKYKWTVKAQFIIDDKITAKSEQIGMFVKLPAGSPTRIPDKLYQEYLRSTEIQTNLPEDFKVVSQ